MQDMTAQVSMTDESTAFTVWRKARQLQAMLTCTNGDEFQTLDAGVRGDLLWACSDMAHEITRLAGITYGADLEMRMRGYQSLDQG